MLNKKQVLEVLNYIKEECKKNEHCHNCQFYFNGKCNIQEPPEKWVLKENEEEEKWTPFED